MLNFHHVYYHLRASN